MSRALGRYRVGTVFALAGAQHTHLLDALDRDGVRIVGGRHESGSILAADGYARVTGGLGVALTIADQGLPNAVAGLACAYHAGSPVLVLLARLPDSWTEPDAEQDAAALALVAPVTKWCRTVPSPERLAEYVDVACRRALAGRPGPVVLQIPQEFLARRLDGWGAAAAPPPERTRAAPDADAIARACELLATARRPLIVCGAGATRAGAQAPLARLCHEFGIPVAGNSQGRGVVPEDGERSFAWPLMQCAAHQADVVLVLGARLKQRLGFGLPPRFAAEARFVQVDVLAEELSRNRRADVPIVGDAALAAAALASGLAERGWRAPDPTWVARALAERLAFLDELATRGDPIHPLRLGRELMRRLPEDAIVVGDGADIQNWMYGALRIRRAPGFMDHYPLGAMGVGTPLAVGAALAARELAARTGTAPRRVVLVTGDGSLGFHPAELHAAARERLPLVVVVGNDGAWGTELHGQRRALGRDLNTALGTLPYELLARAFGARGERVARVAELGPALDRAFGADGPALVDVLVDPEAGAAIKADPRAALIQFDELAGGLAARHGGPPGPPSGRA